MAEPAPDVAAGDPKRDARALLTLGAAIGGLGALLVGFVGDLAAGGLYRQATLAGSAMLVLGGGLLLCGVVMMMSRMMKIPMDSEPQPKPGPTQGSGGGSGS